MDFIIEVSRMRVFWVVIALVAVWDIVWKIIASWKAARDKDFAWFLCLVFFNTVGILPIIYLLTHKKRIN